jgi:hypothetical protein
MKLSDMLLIGGLAGGAYFIWRANENVKLATSAYDVVTGAEKQIYNTAVNANADIIHGIKELLGQNNYSFSTPSGENIWNSVNSKAEQLKQSSIFNAQLTSTSKADYDAKIRGLGL